MLDLVGRESIYQPEQTGLIFPEHVGSESILAGFISRQSGTNM